MKILVVLSLVAAFASTAVAGTLSGVQIPNESKACWKKDKSGIKKDAEEGKGSQTDVKASA